MTLHLGAFGSAKRVEAIARHTGKEVTLLGSGMDMEAVISWVSTVASDHVVLILDADRVILHGKTTPEGYAGEFERMGLDVLWAASAQFAFSEPTLRYYFWKFYPRQEDCPYHYLDSRGVIGYAGALVRQLADANERYGSGMNFYDLLTRWFVDMRLGVFQSDLRVGVDHQQDLFGSLDGRMTGIRLPRLGWMHEDLWVREETGLLAGRGLLSFQARAWDFSYSKRRKFSYNHFLKTTPSILLCPADTELQGYLSRALRHERVTVPWRVKWWCLCGYLISLWQLVLVWLINRGETRKYRIFRYAINKNPEWSAGIQKILDYLKRGEAFTFAHFNDGEMTFIKKYLNQNHRSTWFGRRQQRYNPQLGSLLLEALKTEQAGYHVGIPCSTSHPRLRALADSLITNKSTVMPAMLLHHNLRYFPHIIEQLRFRECFFVMNEHQRLDVLERLGVNVKPENKILVPFKNSYLCYDQLKDWKFPDKAVVILMCGMLAKIIIPVWYRANPTVTFLALGSSLDDFIQRSNTSFRLYPGKGLPLTCNIQPTKFFLFGWKRKCPECWNIDPAG